jgi:hypothetical protein
MAVEDACAVMSLPKQPLGTREIAANGYGRVRVLCGRGLKSSRSERPNWDVWA